MLRLRVAYATWTWALCATALEACAGNTGPSAAPSLPTRTASQHYTFTELRTLGGSFSEASGISDGAVVSGYSATSGDGAFKVFAWQSGQMRPLPGFGGPVSYSWTINNDNLISGFSETKKRDPNGEDVNGLGTHLISLPALWSGDRIRTLPLAGGNNGNALGLNYVGLVGGWSEINKRDPSCQSPQVLGIRPVIWKDRRIERVLPIWHGDSVGGVIDINDHGDAIGASGPCRQGVASVPYNLRHGLLWRNGKMIDLGNLGGRFGIEPIGINESGEIVGQSDLRGDKTYHAFSWDGTMHDLGTLPGDCCSVAISIGSDRTVFGYSCHHPGARASPRHSEHKNCRGAIWKNGAVVDVNTLIPVDSRFYIVSIDGGPNKQGQLVGTAYGKISNAERGFVLTPVASP